MKILRLQAENFKRLTAVEITPKGQVVKITGPNKSGKSSVLDSIIAVLGGKAAVPSKPIRTGNDRGKITIDLGGATGKITVTKSFREGHPDELVIIPLRPGFTAQKFLDSLVSQISFDPLDFAGRKPKDQFEILRQIVPLTDKKGKPLNPVEIDIENSNDYQRRTMLNRQLKELDGKVNAIQVPEGTPDKEVDYALLASKIRDTSKRNADIEVERQRLNDSIRRTSRNIELAQTRHAEAVALMKQAEEDEKRFQKELKDLKSRTIPTPENTEELEKQLTHSQAINRAVADKKRKKELTAESLKVQFTVDDLAHAMEERTAAKTEALSRAKFPVPGLAFGQDEVLYNNLPFEQASTAEKLTVSLAIGMHMHSELKVMLIKEGALLDSNSFAIVEKMAKNWDGQIWCELVSTSGDVGIVMEDGHVAKVNQD